MRVGYDTYYTELFEWITAEFYFRRFDFWWFMERIVKDAFIHFCRGGGE